MSPIQLSLFLLVALVTLLYFRRLRRRLFDRLIFVAIGISAIVMIARPDWANLVAQFFGVGRGADLVTYLGLSGLGFLWLQLYSKQREQDEQLTELTRRMAILEAKKPKEK